MIRRSAGRFWPPFRSLQSINSVHPRVLHAPYTPRLITTAAMTAEGTSLKVGQSEDCEELPPLSAADHQIYNHMSEHMDAYHTHFRQTWTLLWNATTNRRRPGGYTLKQFLDAGLQFIGHLTMHHNIEERHIFPLLGQRMPEFRGDLQAQHREIHKGMDILETYLKSVKKGDDDLDWTVLRAKMESWGGVLWEHLDEEVKTLQADNMRKYWSKEEMLRMPM